MSLRLIKIENHLGKAKAGQRKWLKNQRNRKFRRTSIEKEILQNKYTDYEY